MHLTAKWPVERLSTCSAYLFRKEPAGTRAMDLMGCMSDISSKLRHGRSNVPAECGQVRCMHVVFAVESMCHQGWGMIALIGTC